jgi:hypothetical protein
MPHDAENYIEHARDLLAGSWFGPYNVFTLIKEPFFPIYLALVQESGFSLTVANLLLYAAACLIACLAIGPLVRNGFLLWCIFAVTFFNPTTYAGLAWQATRSEMNDSLALIATACALAIFVRRRLPPRRLVAWWCGLSVSLAAFWLTREESIWLAPCLVVFLAAYAIAVRKDRDVRMKLAWVIAPIALCVLSSAAIGRINQHMYGWNVVVETKAPEFVSAYNSLARIVPEKEEYLTPVPRSSREIAYRVSPAALELKPGLEGSIGQNWTAMVCKFQVHLCNDIPGSFFVWAFRDAVAAAGHYTSGRDARDYYVRLSKEIDQACDTGRIACRRKNFSIFPNPTIGDIPAILDSVRDGVGILLTYSQFSTTHVTAPINPLLDDEYAFVTGSITRDGFGYQGWLATDRPMTITIEDASGSRSIDGFLRMPSPDVANVLTAQGHRNWDDRTSRFAFASDCPAGCFIVLTDAQKRQVKVPLDVNTRDFATPHVIYHLDVVNTPLLTYDAALKQRLSGAIALLYQTLTGPWVVLLLLALVARGVRAVVRRRWKAIPSAQDTCSIAVIAGGGLLVTILAVLTVSYSAGFSPEYLGSFVPLMLFGLNVATVLEGTIAYRLIRRRGITSAARR